MKTIMGEAAEVSYSYLEAVRNEWFKLWFVQDASAVEDCPSLRAWQNGDFAAAHCLAYQGEIRRFCATTRQVRLRGVAIVRLCVIDDLSGNTSAYESWATQCFLPRTNVALGHEDIFVLPRSRCLKAGLSLPPHDQNLCDGALINTFYDADTSVGRRVIYDGFTAEDHAALQAAQALRLQLTWLIEPGDQLPPLTGGLPAHLEPLIRRDWEAMP